MSGMSLDSPAADLYTHFSLDSRDTCRELSILLEAKQAQLGSLGFLGESDELAQVRTAQQILSSPEKRATYDQGIDQGMQPTWSTLSFLAQHGEWPAANPQPQNTTYGSYAPPTRRQELLLPLLMEIPCSKTTSLISRFLRQAAPRRPHSVPLAERGFSWPWWISSWPPRRPHC